MNEMLCDLRTRLAIPRVSWQLTLLGLIGGLSASILIVSFISFIRFLEFLFARLVLLFPITENLTPLIGMGLILLLAVSLGLQYYRLGIPFVIYRLRTRDGTMPLKNTVNQFIGASIALASGFVVGREGPAVHLGAAGSSLVGWGLKLPNNATRVLAASGIAAGIAATFNTPLAAVVFVLEVVVKEYKAYIAVPVLLASACGAIVHHFAFTDVLSLSVSHLHIDDIQTAGFLVMLGIAIGLLSTLFGTMLNLVMKASYHMTLHRRLLLAAGVTCGLSWLIPDLNMTEMESVARQFVGQLSLTAIAALFIGKLVACTIALGLGIPGGIIGPLYSIGALASGCFLGLVMPYWDLDPAFAPMLIIIGMGSMMGASLHAPMAAMVAIMEFTNSPHLIVPAMLVMVPAQIIVSQVFARRSLFVQQMKMQGMTYDQSPVVMNLRKTGALSIIESDFQWLHDIKEISGAKGHVLAKEKGEDHDRLFYIDTQTGEKYRMEGIQQRGSLAAVYQRLRRTRRGAVYLYGENRQELTGIITWQRLSEHIHKEVE